MVSLRAGTLCLALAWSGATGAATGSPSARAPVFKESATVLAVQIPVQVIRDGRPVRGLTAADFEVFEGKERQRIAGFEVVDLDASPPAPGSPAWKGPIAPPPPPRKIVLLFDLTTSQIGAYARAREIAERKVLPSLRPGDLIGVAALTFAHGAHMILGFTADRYQVAEALEQLSKGTVLSRHRDPLGLVLLRTPSAALPEQPSGIDTGSLKAAVPEDDTVQTEANQIALLGSRAQERQAGLDSLRGMTEDLRELARQLGKMDGRKQVVYFSQGFDVSAAFGAVDRNEIEEINASLVTGDIWRVDGQRRFANNVITASLQDMTEEFRRSDCSVEVVDTGSQNPDNELKTRPKSDDSLALIANGTGGSVIWDPASTKDALTRMLERTSVTYTLWLEPRGVALDGKFHPLTVRLVSAPRGTTVSARPGYYAPLPASERSDSDMRLEAASRIVGERESGDVPVAVLAAPFASSRPDAFVPVVIDVDGPELLREHSGGPLPVDVYAYAFDDRGAVRDFLAQRMTLDLEKVGPVLRATGLKYFGALRLPPGDYVLKVLVENRRSGRSGFSARRIAVPDFEHRGLVLLPPFVSQAERRWVTAAAPGKTGAATGEPYPFRFADASFVPSARPVLSAREEARIGIVAFNLAGASVDVAVRLLDENGADAAGATFDPVERLDSSGGADRLSTVLRATGLAPGRYDLSVILKNVATGETASASTELAVVAETAEARREP